MLETEVSVQPLRAWAAELAARRGVVVPQFDPAEAGVDAKVLFVLEAPGPMTNAKNLKPGSGFISADNTDSTAAAIWNARDAAGLHDGALHWNFVPWYLGMAKRKPTAAELREGAVELRTLLLLLPCLELVALSGVKAQMGWRKHIAPLLVDGPEVVNIWHPGDQSLNQPGRRDDFNQSVKGIAPLLAQS